MARLINFEKVAIAVSSSRTSAEKEHGSSNNVWGEIFGSFTSFFGDSAISIHIESCGRLTVPITKEVSSHLIVMRDLRLM